jgi:hypothetical protein
MSYRRAQAVAVTCPARTMANRPGVPGRPEIKDLRWHEERKHPVHGRVRLSRLANTSPLRSDVAGTRSSCARPDTEHRVANPDAFNESGQSRNPIHSLAKRVADSERTDHPAPGPLALGQRRLRADRPRIRWSPTIPTAWRGRRSGKPVASPRRSSGRGFVCPCQTPIDQDGVGQEQKTNEPLSDMGCGQ